MKNLNPQAGRQQLLNGYCSLPRIAVITILNEANISLLSYLVMAITIADWDRGQYRFGIIRYSSRELATLFSISHTTLQRNFRKLMELGWLIWDEENKVYKVTNYETYSLRGAQQLSKEISEQIKNNKNELANNLIPIKNKNKQNSSTIQAIKEIIFSGYFKNSFNGSLSIDNKKLTNEDVKKINDDIPF